ncbi:MAG TPA: wax ester/triacylglycerol synthase family O-acyltransferase [Marmoricola sp.]|nr:wax ester/triacylglycerol synthase family O-acyltransferase [Marmoricola sp.]
MAGRKRQLLPPTDSMFLLVETPRTMMHVAALMPFTPPADADSSYLRDLVYRLREKPPTPTFSKRLSHPQLLSHPLQSWVADEEFDIEYHVRRSALASPGDDRELGILVSRLHSHQLDMSRPLWECHVIEGLQDGRFAIYAKIHHSLMDGFSSVKLLARSLSDSPDDLDTLPFWAAPTPPRPKPPKQVRSFAKQMTSSAVGVTKAALNTVGAVGDVTKAVLKLETGIGSDKMVTGREAPNTILNAQTGRNRRLATQHWDTARLRAIGKATNSTLNDVMLSIFGRGLRRYLDELEELPKDPMVAFVPMNIRTDDDQGGGNLVAATLVSLATDVDDPVDQLKAVRRSTRATKKQFKEMGQYSSIAYTGYLFAPVAFQTFTAMAGVKNPLPTTFNLCISNLAGPTRPLYLAGSKLEAVFPMSIPAHGFALNITVQSYAGWMNVGFVGDRDAVPHLQRLAVYCGEALTELEQAVAP